MWKPPTTGTGTTCNSEGCTICTKETCLPNCSAKFKCNSPGTYVLELTVNDGCSVAKQETTVTCKCQNLLEANAGAAQTSLYECKEPGVSNDYQFKAVRLQGTYTTSSVRGNGYLAQTCPTAPAAAAAPAAPAVGSCCPAAQACPACPMCASCPSCTTATPGSAPVNNDGIFTARRKSRSTPAFLSREEKKQDESLQVLLGTALPVALVMVVSLVANVILFKVYKSEEDY